VTADCDRRLPTPDRRLTSLGTLRLSTERDREEGGAIAVLHAAFESGITMLDTADAYCLDADDTGHNERLIAKAIASWSGDRSRITVATKGGLTRPQGAWVADGRARHLAAACAASRRALGVERIALYQLHAPDPKVPLSTSVRALDALRRDGLVEAIGLCNVTVGQIEEAQRIADIATVQVELSLWRTDNLLNGVVEHCLAHGVRVLAHRPLGGRQGSRRASADPLLLDIAARHAATPQEVALATIASLSDGITPVPGATRTETIRSIARARDLRLSGDDMVRLQERFPALRRLRPGDARAPSAPMRIDGEVVLVMGLPGAGKSTFANALVDRGYTRLNRDEAGGALSDLLPALDRTVASGATQVVLDNTYVSRASRAVVIEAAHKHGLPVRCVWLSTTVEESQVNAVGRLVRRYDRLPTPDEMRLLRKRDISAFGPSVQFRYARALEPPADAEGFSRIEIVPFERRRDPSSANRAVIVWCDGILYRSGDGRHPPSSPEDVEVVPGRAETLRRYRADGWRILGMSWQPSVEPVDAPRVEAIFTRMRTLLDLDIEVEYCPHPAGPPVCWCRKPLPGLGALFIHRHALDPARCIYVGAGPQDPLFARRLGFEYREASAFFEPL
jgi:aryl-alcohol dehydrogenase-like predicted oxidoreductase/predicted kinase/histidinol phosphatase-like enzyme